MNHKLVGVTEDDFTRAVLPEFAAQWALDGDGLKGEFLSTGGDIAAALLARDDERLPISGHWEHASMIGK